jgi:predicted permease
MVRQETRRFVRRNPLLSLSAVIILSLGIGISAFTLTLLLALTSLPSPGMRLMNYATIAEATSGGGSRPIPWKIFEQLRTTSRQDIHLAAYSEPIDVTMWVNQKAMPLRVAAVSNDFFSVFTLTLSAGRDFSAVEEAKAGQHVVILSLPLAIDMFKSAAGAVDRYIELDGLPYQVIGVAPRAFEGLFGASVKAWAPANCINPLDWNLAKLGDTSANNKLTAAFAEADLWKAIPVFYGVAGSNRAPFFELLRSLIGMISPRGSEDAPLHAYRGLSTDPVRDVKLRKWSRLGFLLALGFTMVTSLNYCGLLLARSPLYIEEVRLKRTFGARSGRLMLELMTGPAVTAGVGLFAACLLLTGSLVLVSRVSIFYRQLLRGSWQTALLAVGVQILVACVLTLIIALAPALRLVRESGVPRLGYTSTKTKWTSFVLQSVVTLQIASCIAACILAGMIFSAVRTMIRERLGYRADSLSAACILPASHGAPVSMFIREVGPFPVASAIDAVIGQVASLPGVRSVSVAINAPFDRPMKELTLQRMDSSSALPGPVNYTAVSQNYFRTTGNAILRGRSFSSDDLTGRVTEVLINQALKKELWSDEDPVDRPVTLTDAATGIVFTATIVGVVEDMRFSGLTSAPEPTVFLPLKGLAFTMGTPFYIITDGSESVRSLEDRVNQQLSTQMPELSVQHAYSVGDRVRVSLNKEKIRGYFSLGGAFSIAVVACIGLYGALIYNVNTRRRELAIRVCFGASPWVIRKTVMRQAAQCALFAGVLSAPFWPLLERLSSSDLLGRVSWSTWRAALISLACMSGSIVTSWIPAAVAARVSPSEMLKEG